MRVLRGRAADIAADREHSTELSRWTADTGRPGVRVWRPHRQVAFGRRDTHEPGYENARTVAEDRGFPPVERGSGGRAVAYTGTTVAFALTEAIPDLRSGIETRYDRTIQTVQRVLWRLGVPVQRGEPAQSFCPGNHSLHWQGKIVGLAQRVRTDVATVGGIVIVRDHEPIGDVLSAVYEALDIDFDPTTVGSLDKAGGPSDPDRVIEALEAGFREAIGETNGAVEVVTVDAPDHGG
ncbi:MAG: lipoate--protein ligase family protein [Halobacteriales archaeon]|nr:lipoate--protein ligase family protein [Halobacteriales archaeon]